MICNRNALRSGKLYSNRVLSIFSRVDEAMEPVIAFFRPAPPVPISTDPEQIRRGFARYRPRILFWSTLGYGAFYFVRRNISVALPVMGRQLGLDKEMLGLILSMHGVFYGIAKFFNGIIGDRANARTFMATGLAVSALLNICFGLSSGFLALAIFWVLNGWFQGMGYPPCARLLTHWFTPKELATKMSFWNTSHTLGLSFIFILCGYLLKFYDNWRICFFVPAIITLGVSAALFIWLRDTPASVGLPAVDGKPDVEPSVEVPGEFRKMLWEQVFSDPFIWIASMGNFFVYTLRYAIVDWGTTMLMEAKGVSLMGGIWMVVAFEAMGLVGMLCTGWLTDRLFGGRGAPLSLLAIALCGATIIALAQAPAHAVLLNTGLLMAAGFFVYTPQALVAVIVANRASKRAAATAVGLTSIFGYGSTVLSGWGLGRLAQHHGWGSVFHLLIAAAFAGAVLFAIALPATVQKPETGK
jgi:OPA family glycerol-3-phosphate transporter-like MFS transporter/OPA family sugar phosphate sensor protein UhpC-like MFS transporter